MTVVVTEASAARTALAGVEREVLGIERDGLASLGSYGERLEPG